MEKITQFLQYFCLRDEIKEREEKILNIEKEIKSIKTAKLSSLNDNHEILNNYHFESKCNNQIEEIEYLTEQIYRLKAKMSKLRSAVIEEIDELD